MISVSRTASCLRMPNISSCLRMVLAFSTSSSSANDTSSAGVLALRSWSFISRMRGSPMEGTGEPKKAADRYGEGESQVLSEAFGPMPRPVPHLGRYSKASACVRGDKTQDMKRLFRAQVVVRTLWTAGRPGGQTSERFNHRQDHDSDHEDCRHLVDNSIEFL